MNNIRQNAQEFYKSFIAAQELAKEIGHVIQISRLFRRQFHVENHDRNPLEDHYRISFHSIEMNVITTHNNAFYYPIGRTLMK